MTRPLQVYDLDWLAGLWEGEGCVNYNKFSHLKARARLAMCDRDVITHARLLLGNIGTINATKSRRENEKDVWGWHVSSKNDLLCLVSSIKHRLFSRRYDKINELLGVASVFTPPTITLPWVAGYLEGEGSFSFNSTTQQLTVACTDLDVLEGVKKFIGAGNIYALPNNCPDKHKNVWRWGVYGQNARNLMTEVYPMMGNRRQFQIRRAMRWV